MRIVGALAAIISATTPALADEKAPEPVAGAAATTPPAKPPEVARTGLPERPPAAGGVQFGGANVMLYVIRLGLSEHLTAELGFGWLPVLTFTGSVGVMAEQRFAKRWSVYVAGGASGVYDRPEGSCKRANGPDCVDKTTARFVYLRTGFSLRWRVDKPESEGISCDRRLELDVGLWGGVARHSNDLGTHYERDPFLIPMAGLTYLFL
jgi:hypothetical protein